MNKIQNKKFEHSTSLCSAINLFTNVPLLLSLCTIFSKTPCTIVIANFILNLVFMTPLSVFTDNVISV